jgi:hypothetical protein
MTTTRDLTQFRNRLYRSLPGRGDALMDLLDALSSNQGARSVVELSLSPAFRRCWPSISRTIDRYRSASKGTLEWAERCTQEKSHRQAVANLLEVPARRKHWLLAVDGTPYSRPHARCLTDRSIVHQSSPVSGRTPITIGHQYSLAVALPEKARSDEPAWVLPLSSRRVPSNKSPNTVGQEQMWALLDDPQLPWYEELVVVMGDSAYSSRPFLGPLAPFHNLVSLTRVRSNRVFFRAPIETSRYWYGEKVSLSDADTWPEPAESRQFCHIARSGKRYEIRVDRYTDLLMRGTREWKMNERPFDLLRVARYDESGQRLLGKPMWLMLMGDRRAEIDSADAVADYRQRFDQEHFHRFCRQRLLMDAYQTPETEHEENWIQLVCLAYTQLFAARQLARQKLRPWERKIRSAPHALLSPTMVQRDFSRLLWELGTPARSPKPRNLGTGRRKGELQGHRPRRAVVRKAKSPPQRARAPASNAA